MTDDGAPRRRAVIAAGLWFVLAFCIWQVRFDWGVRVCASQYLEARDAYLRGRGPRVELADAMHHGVTESARRATIEAAPAIVIGVVLTFTAARANRRAR
jgi:hypothetical protein